MHKLNCWEAKQCGRYPGGVKNDNEGHCPASMMVPASGIHGGVNGGRACWAIDRTYCDADLQNSYPEKFVSCLGCSFYSRVRMEEGNNFVTIESIRKELKGYVIY